MDEMNGSPLEKIVYSSRQTAVPDMDGKVHIGGGPITKEGQAIPTCSVCEKILIEQMRTKYTLFDWAYTVGHALTDAWVWLGLPREERVGEEDNAVRKCRTCEKVTYRRLRAKSPRFDSFYKLLDATLEGWMDKFLNDEDKDAAFKRDPMHARQLVQFNPRNYHQGDSFILGIKFDCIAHENGPEFPPQTIGEPISEVKEILQELHDKGAKIIVYGWRSNVHTRGNPWYRKQAEKWMKEHHIPYNFFYDGKGLLVADVFVSKRVIGASLATAYNNIVAMMEDPEKKYLQSRHVL